MAKDKILKPFVGIITPENKFTVDTIDDLKSRNYLTTGDIVELNGYYTAGDGAHHKRKIESAGDGSGVQLANGLWANIVHSEVFNLKWFGARGDNTTDDTKIIQNAVDYSFAKRSLLFFDAGIYIISEPIVMRAEDTDWVGFASRIHGAGISATTIKKISHVGQLEDSVFTAQRDSGSGKTACYNLNLENMTVSNVDGSGNKKGYGLYFKYMTSKLNLKVLSIAADKTLYFNENAWTNHISDLRLQPKTNGIYFRVNGTSNTINNVFTYGCTGVAYFIKGEYTSISNIAADHCTGTVYDFSYGSFDVSGIGSESAEAETIISAQRCTLNISGASILRPTSANSTIISLKAWANIEFSADISHSSSYVYTNSYLVRDVGVSYPKALTIKSVRFNYISDNRENFVDFKPYDGKIGEVTIGNITNNFTLPSKWLTQGSAITVGQGLSKYGNVGFPSCYVNMKDYKTTSEGVNIGALTGFGSGDILYTKDKSNGVFAYKYAGVSVGDSVSNQTGKRDIMKVKQYDETINTDRPFYEKTFDVWVVTTEANPVKEKSYSITLPIEMKDTKYSINVQVYNDLYLNCVPHFTIKNKTTTSFVISIVDVHDGYMKGEFGIIADVRGQIA